MVMKQLLLKVNNMSCQHCVSSIHECVSRMVGVKEVKVDLKMKLVQIEYDDKFTNELVLIETIEDQGFDIEL